MPPIPDAPSVAMVPDLRIPTKSATDSDVMSATCSN